LRGSDGRAYVTDFQLAIRFKQRNLLFRIAAYEDLRHLLKHKLRYAPEAISAAERRVLARKSVFTRLWMATGKRVYQWVTRDILRFTDREGGGPRLVFDAPRISARLLSHPQVREVAIVAYPDRRAGTGLYAFVEADLALSERVLRDFMAGGDAPKPPEHLQITDELPRGPGGEVRSEILQLVAMNQVDLIDALIGNERERALIQRILDDRRNMRDRFAY
jgi:AMP-binding enzyme